MSLSLSRRVPAQVGYYVNTEYDSSELMEAPPEQIMYDRLTRNILADKPRVTRYQIDWSAGMAQEGSSAEPDGMAAPVPEAQMDMFGAGMMEDTMAVEPPMAMAE